MKKLLSTLLLSLWPCAALAGVPCTVPNTFVNNTIADANQVNANFSAVISCLLNAAQAGSNADITALNALTTPVTPGQGGSSTFIGGASTGTANAQVVATTVPTGFTLARGNSVVFIAGFSNTGATQVNVNGTGLTNVYRPSPLGPQPMTGGEIVANQLVW